MSSLHTVLELRSTELRKVQTLCAETEEYAKQLPTVQKLNSTLLLQIECLKEQLEKKSLNEQYVLICIRR